MMTPCQGDLDSICSLSSLDSSTRHVDRPNERLMELLTRPRELGGYDGCLNYTGFVALAASLGWNQEDTDDCWYDILMGEPCAETKDMARVAACVCSYCLASPLLIRERQNGLWSAPTHPKTQQRAESLSADRNTTSVSFPSAQPSRPTASVEAVAPENTQKSNTATGLSLSQKGPLQRRRSSSLAYRRYAVGTISSEHKRTSSSPRRQSCSPQHGRAVSLSPRRATTASPTPQASGDPGNAVFLRLYQKGIEHYRARTSKKPNDEVVSECTFHPHISPYRRQTSDTKNPQYNKPTQSYFAKLTAQEHRPGVVTDAPETPRVTYHPAPGPSPTVPHGYVEGVARLRSYVASRYTNSDFVGSLRGDSSHNVAYLVEAPILRLPVTVNGVTNSVDVRLASPDTRAHRSRRGSLARENFHSPQLGSTL